MNTSNLLSSLSQEQRGSIASSFKSVSGGAELTLHADLGGVGGALAPHPCLTGNNSINVDTEEDKYLTELRKKDLQHYKEKVLPILSGYHKKKTYALQKTIEQACLEWGEKSIGVLHLTFADNVDHYEAERRMNSLRTNVLSKRYSVGRGGRKLNNYITIFEKGEKNGRCHFHVLFIKDGADFKTGSYWTFNPHTKRREFHPNADCRKEFDFLRGLLAKYKFGEYVRVEPLRSVEGGAKYFSKYVGKGHFSRDESMHGKQLIRSGSGFKKYASIKFSWVGGIARGRRGVLARVGKEWGIDEEGGLPRLNYILGSRWQHWAKDQILACCCFSGEALGKASRSFIESYAENKWGIKIQFGVATFKNTVIMGHDPFGIYSANQLYEMAMRKLIERVEEIEFSQYDPNLIQF